MQQNISLILLLIIGGISLCVYFALLLQQKLTEVGHPDHTLITYPDLGHLFYPSSQWITAIGPMDQKVLEDLFGWLSDPVREFKKLSILSLKTLDC
jgi:uncharacterized protein